MQKDNWHGHVAVGLHHWYGKENMLFHFVFVRRTHIFGTGSRLFWVSCLLISNVYKRNDLCVERTIRKAHITTKPSSLCWDIKLQLAPDSEANTPPPSPSSHLTGGREDGTKRAGIKGWVEKKGQLNGTESGGTEDACRQAEIYMEGEREMRKSDCLVHLPDYREKNGQETQTLHTDTWRHMRAWAVTAVNRQKPKMVENGGPLRPLLARLPLSHNHTIIGAPLGSHTHTNIETHTHTHPWPCPSPQMSLLLMRSVAERSYHSDRRRDEKIEIKGWPGETKELHWCQY